jgi:hypothetical protein
MGFAIVACSVDPVEAHLVPGMPAEPHPATDIVASGGGTAALRSVRTAE